MAAADHALARLKLTRERLPPHMLELLQREPADLQIIIFATFCDKVKSTGSPAQLLHDLCREKIREALRIACHNVSNLSSRGVNLWAVFDTAYSQKVLRPHRYHREAEAVISALSPRLRCMAACFAVGIFLESLDGNRALTKIKGDVAKMQRLFQEA